MHSRNDTQRMTLQQLASTGRRVAAGLQRLGIGPGDPVAFQLKNSLPAAAVFFGLVYAGAVLVPVGHALGPSELLESLRASKARAVFVESLSEGDSLGDVLSVSSRPAELEHIITIAVPAAAPAISFDELIDAGEIDALPRLDPAAPAVIGWTSGSTAAPKGALLSHRALCAEVRLHMSDIGRLRTNSVLSTSPVSHVTGMLVSLLVPPIVDQDVHLMDYWEPADVLQLMSRHGLSAGTGAPYFLQSLLNTPECRAEHHRLIDVAPLGGASVAPALIERADALGITAFKGYGCTEHPSISLGRPTDPLAIRARSDGVPCAGVEVRVRSVDGRHRRTGTGEIITRGPDQFSGYLDPSMNAEAFDCGWYRTGDIGTVDDQGYITIVDRLKDIIIRSGLNVSAAEVESVLSSLAGVAEVAVVAAPDERTGEHGCAFIRPAPGYAAPALAEVQSHLAARGLAKYKWPEEIRVYCNEFPRTAAGKVQKAVLREQVAQPVAMQVGTIALE